MLVTDALRKGKAPMNSDDAERAAAEFISKQTSEMPLRVGIARRSSGNDNKWVVLVQWKAKPGAAMDGGDTLVVVDDKSGVAEFYLK